MVFYQYSELLYMLYLQPLAVIFIRIFKEDDMEKVNTRNRNEGKFYKNGKKKPANWEYRFEAAPVNGKRQQISDAGYTTEKAAYEAGIAAYEKYNSAGSVNNRRQSV